MKGRIEQAGCASMGELLAMDDEAFKKREDEMFEEWMGEAQADAAATGFKNEIDFGAEGET